MTNKQYRIAMISDHGDPFAKIGGEQAGGQNLYVKYLGEKLVERGYKVDVFTRWQSKKMPRIKTRKGLRVIRIKAGEVKFLSKNEFIKVLPDFINGIKDFIDKKGSYDIIHSNYWLSGLTAIELKKKCGIPFVHTFHSLGAVKHRAMGIDTKGSRFREKAESDIVKNADLIVSTSPQEVSDIRKYCDKDADNVVVVPVGVDLTKFCFYSKKIARKKLNAKEDYIILFVGRFEERKGVKTLIKAVSHLTKILPEECMNFNLWVIGGDVTKEGTGIETEEIKSIRKLIKDTETGDFIKFVGRVPNFKLKKYYGAADVTVVPSHYEPFGIVPIESMACGTPVIASEVGGLQFTIEDGVTGYHIPPKDYKEIAQRIKDIFTNAELRMELSSNAVENINKQFSWEQVATMISKVYLGVINNQKIELEDNLRVSLTENNG